VDPIYFDSAYYLGPDKGGDRAYSLLAAAMRETQRCALAKWAARGKGYLVLIRPIEKGLIMQTLHYADEVRQIDEVPLGDAQIKDPELKLAVQLVDQISSEEFHPENYEDEVRKRYHEAIQRKVEGQEVTTAAPEQPRAQIIDLMEALKASLAGKAKTAEPAQEKAKTSEARADKSKASGRGRKSA
jgi:DNA end-binding protein Ku